MAGRASIVGAAATHVGKVREHNEDSHYFDGELGVFLVCDGMGGHAKGEDRPNSPYTWPIYQGAWGIDVRNSDGLIVISDLRTGFWAFKMDGFDGWNGRQWGVVS